MKVKVCFDESEKIVDIINIPNSNFGDLEKIQETFFEWLFDKTNNHKFWVCDDTGEKLYCAYDTDAFIEWINKNYLISGQKAKCLDKNVENLDSIKAILYF